MTVVVKLGTSLVVGDDGRVREDVLRARGAEVAAVVQGGEPVCVVSSGAIALGLPRLGLSRRPRSVPRLQAASALGQARLQAAWDRALQKERLLGAQILLTAAEVADRSAYLNVRNALGELVRRGAVPIVNENDATATDEISFGDNDALAAQVAVLCGARLLVLLTSVEGVYTQAPGSIEARLIREGAEVREASFGAASARGRGGMESKIQAAELAAGAGIATVIASGTSAAALGPLVAGDTRGTRFPAAQGPESAYKLWLRYGKRVDAAITVDDGARKAVAAGASLLAVGVVGWTPEFRAGDGIELRGEDGDAFARGIASVDSVELAGRPVNVEAVHRDRLVLL